ncbi:hypothetical protein ACNVED_01275 [Legionella sp. D16C41]|uniref:hypothetical protein n=1 Tax=Legionella sp. D16C41 TaxID=3402688 RepID=UPI003AF9BD89
MSLLEELKALNFENLSIALISTTSKKHGENRLLPFRQFGKERVLSIILTDEKIAKQALLYLDQYITTFLVDVERKQAIHLWDLAKTTVKGQLLPYKPNDITVDSAYHLVNQYFNYQLSKKKILIYGTGNIATKLALRLAEHDSCITLTGRNENKARQVITALNLILPSYTEYKINEFNKSSFHDVLITAISAENILDVSYLDCLNQNAFVVDIGINNLTSAFIEKAVLKNISIMRLDVRIATPLLVAHNQIANSSFFKSIAGYVMLHGVNCVAGGIIGKKGDVVLDAVWQPKHIIGIANGTGGLKKNEEYTDIDKKHVKIIAKTI